MHERHLAAIMFTDIIGYTALMGKDEDKAFDLLRKNREIHKEMLGKFNGILIKEMGDGMLCSFQLASDAVRCAMNIQMACKEQYIPLKIGIHEGETIFEGNDVLGDSVNIAFRLQESTENGGILISNSVYKDIKNKSALKAEFLGERSFKNVDDVVKVYRICCGEELNVPGNEMELNDKLPDKSIAVLPFMNMSNDQEQDYFCDGLSEELLNKLAQVGDLKVAARTSSFSFRGKDTDIAEIGKKLKVKTILEGSVRKSGTRIRITAQLINVADGYHLWSERYDRNLEDIFEVQDEISLAILNALKIKLLGNKDQLLLKPRSFQKDAYQLYLKGKYQRYRETPEGFLKAVEYYKKAIELEPGFADAYAALATVYFLILFYTILPPDECIKPFEEAVQKAHTLDESNAEAFTAEAFSKHWFYWDFDHAEKLYRRALQLNPNYAETFADFGNMLALIGRKEEALAHINKAVELDPFSITLNFYAGWGYFLAGEFELMYSIGEKMLEMEPPWIGHTFMGFKCWMEKRYQEAVTEFELGTRSQLPLSYTWLGCMYGINGEKEKAQKMINRLLELSKNQYVGAYNIGLIYLGLGDTENAYKCFIKGCDEQHDGILLYLNQKLKVLPGLKKDKLMEAFIKKLGLS